MKTVIVGGVAGGATAAARLRRLDEKAEIIMFERGEYVSFANCGLPYYIGGVITNRSALTLQTPTSFLNRFNVDVRVNSEVIDINPEEKTVTLTLTIDTSISSVMDYFEIFMQRMLLCRRAADYFGLTFRLNINGATLL